MVSTLIKSPDQMLLDMLRIYRAGVIRITGTDPGIDSGSDIYLEFKTICDEIAIPLNNLVAVGDALMPDTATGQNLDRIVQNYGLVRRQANAATGFVTITCTQPVFVATGSRMISTFGLVYSVDVGGTYSNGSTIQVTSVDKGSNTNLPPGAVLSWLDTPPFTAPTVTVFSEISGGVDIEDDNTLRNRLFNLLQNPPQYGNWQDIALLGEQFNPYTIQKEFVYSCANGPATQHLAAVGYADPITRHRDLSNIDLSNLTSFISGNVPGYTETIQTTVSNMDFWVSLQLNIPYPVGSPNLGLGGGWLDFNPFPSINFAGTGDFGTTLSLCDCMGVTSSTQFTLHSASAPSSGISRISWIDKANGWIVRTATVLNYTFSGSNTYNITIDTPFAGIQTGDLLFPASVAQQIYIDNILTFFANLGPGEKTNSVGVLPFAYRQPRPNLSWYNNVSSPLLKAVINSGSEVLDCQFATRQLSLLGSDIGAAAPALPTVISDPPKIYIPAQIGLYPPISPF